MKAGLGADKQRASVHDGKGIRTTVFFKGCPLSCRWCHNPECISFKKELLVYPEKCIHCGRCAEGCFSGARVICGKEMTPDDVLTEIMPDATYYGADGGVTFSGGEPLAQKEFLNECIDKCKENGINSAIETSLIYYDEKIFEKLDFVMADLKIWNSALHKEYTGAGNDIIIKNFKKLNTLDIPIIARTPVIPEINQEIDCISAFLKTLKNVKRYELLPYHPLGNSKKAALGLKNDGFSVPSKEYMKELEKYAYIR